MKVLITDGISKEGLEILKKNNHDITEQFYKPEELIKVIPEYDGIIVRSATKVRKDAIDAGKNLKLIARAGTGIDNIDHEYARSKGIQVLNAPGENSASAAELVIAHMFALARFIPQANITMRKGEWNKKKYKGIELAGKTLGIIGFGRIGQIVAKMALGLGMKILVNDVAKAETALDVQYVEKEQLLKESDFISLHIPKLDKAMIGEAELKMMKNSAYLINDSRGNAIDETSLIAALDNDEIAGAGLDVFIPEPPTNTELINHPKISVTPHIGAATKEAQIRVGIHIANKVVSAFK